MLQKGLFLKSRNKDGITVDGAKKEVLVENILLTNCKSTLNTLKTSKQKKIAQPVDKFNIRLSMYQSSIEKHINDLFFISIH